MRNLFLLFAFVAISSILTYAQPSIGFKIGGNTNFATVTGITEAYKPTIDNYTGYTAEVEIGIRMDKKFMFKPGFSFLQRGFSLGESTIFDLGFDLPVGAKADIRTNNFSIEALLQYDLINGSDLQVYVLGGPYYAYAINGFIQTKASAIIDFNIARIDMNFNNGTFNRNELGMAAGGGIATSVGNGQIFADLKYLHGFTDQSKDALIDVGYKNRSINYSFGYRFNF